MFKKQFWSNWQISNVDGYSEIDYHKLLVIRSINWSQYFFFNHAPTSFEYFPFLFKRKILLEFCFAMWSIL